MFWIKTQRFMAWIFLAFFMLSTFSFLMPGQSSAQTLQDFGLTNKDKVEEIVDYLEWVDAATIKVFLKNNKTFTFTMTDDNDDNGSDPDIAKHRFQSNVDFSNESPSHGCFANVKVEQQVRLTDQEYMQTKKFEEVILDMDFRANQDGDCQDGNSPKFKPRKPELSIAYFKWTAPNQISTVDSKNPGTFTKSVTTVSMDGATYEVFIRDSEASANECKDRVLVNKSTNKLKFYELDDKYGGDPPNEVNVSGCNYNKSAFPLNNYLWDIANSPQSVAQVPPATAGGTGAGGANDAPTCEGSIDNGFGWIICPALSGIDGLIKGAEAFIESKLSVNTDVFEDTNGEGLRNIWQTMARFASGLLVIVALVMIISTVLDTKAFSNYTIKKTLPNIVFAAIGIWISWAVMTTYIQFMNDLGRGLASVMYTALPDAKSVSLESIVAKAAQSSDAGTDAVAGAVFVGLVFAGGASVGIFGLIAVALSAMVAILVAVFVLAVREIMIIMGVVVAPIAIAAWILPNTKKAWTFWFSNMNKLLLMFPMISALFAGAKIMSSISAEAANANSGFLEVLFPVIIYVIPLFFLPKIFKSAGGILNGVTAAANKLGQSASKGARENLTNRQKELRQTKAEDRRNRANERYSLGQQTMRDRARYGQGFALRREGREALGMAAEKRKEKGLQSSTERLRYGMQGGADSVAVTEARAKARADAAKYTRPDANTQSSAEVIANENADTEVVKHSTPAGGLSEAAKVARAQNQEERIKYDRQGAQDSVAAVEAQNRAAQTIAKYTRPDANTQSSAERISNAETVVELQRHNTEPGGVSVAADIAESKALGDLAEITRDASGRSTAEVEAEEAANVKYIKSNPRSGGRASVASELARANAAAEITRLEDVPVYDSAGNPVMDPVLDPSGAPVLDAAGVPVMRQRVQAGSIAEKDAQIKRDQARARVQIEDATLDARRAMFDQQAEVAKVRKAERKAAVEAAAARMKDTEPDLYFGAPANIAEAIRLQETTTPEGSLRFDALLSRLMKQGRDAEIRQLIEGGVDEHGNRIDPLTGDSMARLASTVNDDEWYGTFSNSAGDVARASVEYARDTTGAIMRDANGNPIPNSVNLRPITDVPAPNATVGWKPGTWGAAIRATATDSQLEDYANMLRTRTIVGDHIDQERLEAINRAFVDRGRPDLQLTMADIARTPSA